MGGWSRGSVTPGKNSFPELLPKWLKHPKTIQKNCTSLPSIAVNRIALDKNLQSHKKVPRTVNFLLSFPTLIIISIRAILLCCGSGPAEPNLKGCLCLDNPKTKETKEPREVVGEDRGPRMSFILLAEIARFYNCKTSVLHLTTTKRELNLGGCGFLSTH